MQQMPRTGTEEKRKKPMVSPGFPMAGIRVIDQFRSR
jgi:hypothetical protein